MSKCTECFFYNIFKRYHLEIRHDNIEVHQNNSFIIRDIFSVEHIQC